MKKLVIMLSLVGLLGVLPAPAPADATVVDSCVNETIASCNSDFSGSTERLIGLRGWCYIIRWYWCGVIDPIFEQ